LGDFFANSSGHPAKQPFQGLTTKVRQMLFGGPGGWALFSKLYSDTFMPFLFVPTAFFSRGRSQGDQIGRIFSHLGDFLLWAVL
jgi:hypothetical protein